MVYNNVINKTGNKYTFLTMAYQVLLQKMMDMVITLLICNYHHHQKRFPSRNIIFSVTHFAENFTQKYILNINKTCVFSPQLKTHEQECIGIRGEGYHFTAIIIFLTLEKNILIA